MWQYLNKEYIKIVSPCLLQTRVVVSEGQKNLYSYLKRTYAITSGVPTLIGLDG